MSKKRRLSDIDDGESPRVPSPKKLAAGRASLLPPAALVSAILSRRASLDLPSMCAPAEQPTSLDVWTLCDDYGDDDYDAMDDDVHRNAAYTRAFAAVAPHRNRWVEIGCGASATLTRLALKSAPAATHITSFEVNAESARSAVATLGRAHLSARTRVVVGKSTVPDALPDPAATFDTVLHEVFGIFASSEGCALVLEHARATYSRPHCRVPRAPSGGRGNSGYGLIPSRCATFFTLCHLQATSLDVCESLLCNSDGPRPKVLLAPAAPMEAMALCSTSRAFEYFDTENARPLSENQRREHRFVVEADGLLNCLGCFIWVDLGIGTPPPTRAPPRDDEDDEDDEDEDERTRSIGLASRFPFGDGKIPAGGTDDGRAAALNDFTSLCTDATLRSCRYASNWQNPLLLLPEPAVVHRGDQVLVTSTATVSTVKPSYRFDVAHIPASASSLVPTGTCVPHSAVDDEEKEDGDDDRAALEQKTEEAKRKRRVASSSSPNNKSRSLGSLVISFDDLYPDFGDDV